MSTFVSLWHSELSSKIPLPTPATDAPPTPGADPQSREALRKYFLGLRPPRSRKDSQDGLRSVQMLTTEHALVQPTGSEEEALWVAIAAKLTVGLYTQFLETYLNEASEAEAELEWWGDIERSRWRTTYFLLQTFPSRVVSLSHTILRRIRSQNIPLRLSLFTPSSLRELFPTRNSLRPNTLTIALFPHLRYEPYSTSVSARRRTRHISLLPASPVQVRTVLQRVLALPAEFWDYLTATLDLPVRLARHECTYKRKELASIRDQRAAVLGELLVLKDHLNGALAAKSSVEIRNGLATFCLRCNAVLGEDAQPRGLIDLLDELTNNVLLLRIFEHALQFQEHGLHRPSRLTLLWPKLVLLPPLGLYAVKVAYHSRASLEQTARDALATVQGFWNDWLLGPLKDVVRTVRAGSDDGIIVTKESVRADLDSLERMALSLAQDKLNYTPEQMAALSQQLRHGDLTAVMQIYEDDIKNPLKSAIGGSLLRTLLVQVQKAKVDIDQALSGIDKLLKSQELTFAFVGVAPSLAIVWGLVGYLRSLWSGSRGNGRYGGRTRRVGTWLAIRRIERLLVVDTSASSSSSSPSSSSSRVHYESSLRRVTVDPRTSGLLLLSTTQLRKYAEGSLPARSRLREGFLEDVSDLEDPRLGRAEKLHVVDRMWKSWGDALGWRVAALEHASV